MENKSIEPVICKSNNEEKKETSLTDVLKQKTQMFLSDSNHFLDIENIGDIITIISKQEDEIREESFNKGNRIANYDKYSKTFNIEDEKGISIGNIIGSRRWGINISLPENLENFGDGKKVRKLMYDSKLNDHLYQELNKTLANNLSMATKKTDALTSLAYNKIAERSGLESKQIGVFAEQVVIGVLEGISIDHPDLGFSVIESNAHQDVQDKIDFIILTKHKKRGAGINREDSLVEEKSIGIQFTTNPTAFEHKNDQIEKSKNRGVSVDDIIYVEIKKELLQEATKKWESSGKKISGPWEYLPAETRIKTINRLFGGLLEEEQEKSLQKIVSRG